MEAASVASAVAPEYSDRGASDEGRAAPRAPGLALAAHLGQAILAVGRLRDTLDAAAHQHAEAAAYLAAALAAAPSTYRGGRMAVPVRDEDPCLPRARGSTAEMVGSVRAARHLAGLTMRETEVLRLLAVGHSNRRIAAALCLSPRTVQRHVANAYLKIGAHCRAEAAVYALQHGLA